MTMEKDQIILVNDFINLINAELKDKIQEKAVWSVTAPPPNATSAVKARLQDEKTLFGMTSSDKIAKDQIIKFSTLYDAVQTLFQEWCHVRKFTYTFRWGGWSNGGGIPWGQAVYTNYASLKSAVDQTIIKEKTSGFTLKEQPITPNTLQEFCEKLFEAWQKIADEYHEDILQVSCHGNCHGNCHGSGGRR